MERPPDRKICCSSQKGHALRVEPLWGRPTEVYLGIVAPKNAAAHSVVLEREQVYELIDYLRDLVAGPLERLVIQAEPITKE